MNDFETAEDGEKSLSVEMAETLAARVLEDMYVVQDYAIVEDATQTLIEIDVSDYAVMENVLDTFRNYGYEVKHIDFGIPKIVLSDRPMRS